MLSKSNRGKGDAVTLRVYHGTPAPIFTEFRTPAYFSISKDEALNLGNERDEGPGRIIQACVQLHRPAIFSLDEFADFVEMGAVDADRLRGEGFDAAVLVNDRGEIEQVVAFDAVQIVILDQGVET